MKSRQCCRLGLVQTKWCTFGTGAALGASRKEVGFFVAESDEEMESTSVFFQMNQFTFLSLRQLVYSSTLATMKKSYTDASPEWFPKQTECIF